MEVPENAVLAGIARHPVELPASDPQALAAALRELMNDPAKRAALAVAGQKRVREKFDIAKVSAELAALYRGCSVGLVLSHTNLSLLPVELMACGCAVVSNSGPNVEWLLTDAFAQLARPTPEHLADAIVELLSNEQLRSKKAAAGIAFAEQTDWETEVKAIERGMYKALGISVMDECNV